MSHERGSRGTRRRARPRRACAANGTPAVRRVERAGSGQPWNAPGLAFAGTGCAAAVTTGGADGAVATDAGSPRATDVAVTESSPDAARSALRGPYSALARARDRAAASDATASTWLVVGSRKATQNAILVEPRIAGQTAALDPTYEVPGTEGREPVAAARDGDRVAVFLEEDGATPEIVLVDGTDGTPLATTPLADLARGAPQYAWIALHGDRVTCAAAMGDGIALVIESFVLVSGELRALPEQRITSYFDAAIYEGADATDVVVAAIAPSHAMDRYRVRDTGLERLSGSTPETILPASDGATLAHVTSDHVVVDGQDLGPLPRLSQIDGAISVAARDDGGLVVALTADEGRRWIGARSHTGAALTWTTISATFTRGLQSQPAAHADRQHLGVFYLETSLGTEPPAVRYLGLPDAP